VAKIHFLSKIPAGMEDLEPVATHTIPTLGDISVTRVDDITPIIKEKYVWVRLVTGTMIWVPQELIKTNIPEPVRPGAVVLHNGLVYQRRRVGPAAWLPAGSLTAYTWDQMLAQAPDELPTILKA